MRRRLGAVAVASLLVAQPVRASDVPLHEVQDQVLGGELVAAMLEAQLDRLHDALTNPDL